MHFQTNIAGAAAPPPPIPNPRADILIISGVRSLAPNNWQSHWELLPNAHKVGLGGEGPPRLHEWVARLDETILDSACPVVLAAHDLACISVAWWAALRWNREARSRVLGALLVAPPDVDRIDVDFAIRDFRPAPRQRIPFPTIVVGRRNDPLAPFDRSARLASHWGSEFVDGTEPGHIGADPTLGEWSNGLRLLAGLLRDEPGRLIAELGLRTVLR